MRKKDVEDAAVKVGMGLAPQVVVAGGIAGKVAAVAAIATNPVVLVGAAVLGIGCLLSDD
jgi:hypothetical protein